MSNIVVDAVEATAPVEATTTNEVVNTEVTSEASAEETTNVIPDKFAGKSTEEIIGSYQNLEKELGRKAQEVGELRKLSDSFLQAQINTNHQSPKQQNSQETPEPEVDFFDDPNLAVNKAIENHPRFKEFQQYQTQQVQTNAKTHLEQKHPDFTTVVADSKFQEWVKESPIRSQLFKAADAYNFDAANELLSTWKDRTMINKTQEVDAQSEANRQSALRTGATESRASAGSTGGGKQFRRADLIRMKIENPNQYESMQDEIYSAYAEGRVK
jgi:hypothetical protein